MTSQGRTYQYTPNTVPYFLFLWNPLSMSHFRLRSRKSNTLRNHNYQYTARHDLKLIIGSIIGNFASKLGSETRDRMGHKAYVL